MKLEETTNEKVQKKERERKKFENNHIDNNVTLNSNNGGFVMSPESASPVNNNVNN